MEITAKKRICVLLEGVGFKLRGEFMAVHNRLKYMICDSSSDVHAFLFTRHYDNLTSRLKRIQQIDFRDDFYLDNVHYHCSYYKRSYIDYLGRCVSNYQTMIEANRVISYWKKLENYDVIYANSLYTGLLALELKKKFGIPCAVMWHGSSIHSHPFQNKTVFNLTKRVLLNANHNFFVSNALFGIARKIAGTSFVGSLSPNGVDTRKYFRYSDERRNKVARNIHVDLKLFNIAYIGNYLPIKNVQILPRLFQAIYCKCKDVCFHIIGDGPFEKDFHSIELPIRYWGNQMPDSMADIYNCMNLIVLPSLDEGLPMTCLEAVACGTSFVGSRVGGIADVVGLENTVPHSSSFDEDFANLCIQKVGRGNSHAVFLPEQYDIGHIVNRELQLLKDL